MSDFVFSDSTNRCRNVNCKFVKNHTYPCSNAMSYDVSKYSNEPCDKKKNHNNDSSFYKDESMTQYTQPSMFNTQYQSLINDHKQYSNFNNNNDQRKFIINYITINNYGNSSSKETTASKLEDLIGKSGFSSEFSNPSNHIGPYRR